jgi:arylformamidase
MDPDAEHGLLVNLYGQAPVTVQSLAVSVGGESYWRKRLDEGRGEVVFGILRPNGRMLVTRTAGYPQGAFRVPSGGLRHGEPVLEALYREVAEEVGLAFDVLRYAGLIRYPIRFQNGRMAEFVSFCFLLRQRPADERQPLQEASDDELQACQDVTPLELEAAAGALDSLGGELAEWGPYRAASTRLAGRAWSDYLAAAALPACADLDLSLPIAEGMALFPGDAGPGKRLVAFRAGDAAAADAAAGGAAAGWEVSEWTLGAHLGTHVDAPRHLIAGGRSVDQIPVGDLSGLVVVVDCRRATAAARLIEPGDLECIMESEPRIVLLKTGLGRELAAGLVRPGVGLSPQAAGLLAASGISAVGIEALSVDPLPQGPGVSWADAHHILLGQGLSVIEGLDLTLADAGIGFLAAYPLRLAGAEAAPCRAVYTAIPAGGRPGRVRAPRG